MDSISQPSTVRSMSRSGKPASPGGMAIASSSSRPFAPLGGGAAETVKSRPARKT
jgi:hypothetical protein